jgi:hypothetical protein
MASPLPGVRRQNVTRNTSAVNPRAAWPRLRRRSGYAGAFAEALVDPASPLPQADREYVLVASEWYLSGNGLQEPASLSMEKARAMEPDWTTFNGYAN